MSIVLLVRHGQASWGSADYDVLSDHGQRQAEVVGTALKAWHLEPRLVLHGAMTRQRETARIVADVAGWADRMEEDPGWDEMDHTEVLERQPRTFDGDAPSRREFQAWFEAATQRWTSGEFDDEYAESFPGFGRRVTAALEALTKRLGRADTAVVVTSGGPIARIVADLLGGDDRTHGLLAPVVVNGSVTKLVVGRRGVTLVSFNDHSHLEAVATGLVTYR